MKHKKKSRRHPLHKLVKGNLLIPLLFVIIAFGVLLTSGAMVNKSATDPTEQYGESQTSSESGKQNLQLKSLQFVKKPSPTESTSCRGDSGHAIDPSCVCPDAHVICKDKKCEGVDADKSGSSFKSFTCGIIDASNWCGIEGLAPGGTGHFCIGKPVIYLYPVTTTEVHVTVKTLGSIVVSDPPYPASGWDVIAHPNGAISYQNKEYSELFYETSTQTLNKPTKGFIFEKANLESELRSFITRLGLTKIHEQQEFLDWWMPRLQQLDTPYYFVSILDRSEKNRLDTVEITPKPTTFIDFIVYFKPLDQFETVTPLNLPQTPIRNGFTAVEWGGVIDP